MNRRGSPMADASERPILGPHHDWVSPTTSTRAMEYAHHGMRLFPGSCDCKIHRSLMKGLGSGRKPIWLRPGVVKCTTVIAPLNANRDLDTRGWLNGVTNFSFHKHLPHYAVTGDHAAEIHILGRQPIDLSRPHPFIEAGNTEFNSFAWMPPAGRRGGEVLLADSTIFSTLFGADERLKQFWKNLAAAQ